MDRRVLHVILQNLAEIDDFRNRLVRGGALRYLRHSLHYLFERSVGVGLLRGQTREPVTEVEGQAQGTHDVADHALRLHPVEGDDLAYVGPAVHGHDVLDDLLAAFHAEVQVDVRHLTPGGVQEPAEVEPVYERIDVGDAGGVGHQAAGSGAPPRTRGDSLRGGPAPEFRDYQEVAREAHVLYHLEFSRKPLGLLRGEIPPQATGETGEGVLPED